MRSIECCVSRFVRMKLYI